MSLTLENYNLKFLKGKGIPNRYVGVEIEIAGFNPDKEDKFLKLARKWHLDIGDDGSIDPECASDHVDWDCICESAEIRTSPAKGEAFIKQITQICKGLADGNAKVNDSCGLHVHIDARDLDDSALMRLAVLWSKVEQEAFTLVKSNRLSNDYCKPWNQTLLEHAQSRVSKAEKIATLKRSFNASRYRSLNFHSLTDLHTVENRMHEGTLDPKKIIQWALLNVKLVNFAKRSSMAKVMKVNRIRDIK